MFIKRKSWILPCYLKELKIHLKLPWILVSEGFLLLHFLPKVMETVQSSNSWFDMMCPAKSDHVIQKNISEHISKCSLKYMYM